MPLYTYPRQDAFETTISADIGAADASIPLNEVPSFTLSGSNRVYMVIDYDKPSKIEIVKISGFSALNATVATRGIAKYEGGGSTAASHASGAKVIISDNWQAWKDIADAIASLESSKANAGANSDITSLSGLTTPLSIAQGGTAATTAAAARSSLSAAKSGVNSDITELTGLATPLSVPQGGSGLATWTANGAVIGNGTSAPTFVAPGSSGNVLKSNGTTWVSGAIPVGVVSALLDSSAHSDTVTASVVAGDLLYGNATPKWDRLAIGTVDKVLVSSGSAPSWQYAPEKKFQIVGINANSNAQSLNNQSRWCVTFSSATKILWRDNTTATTIQYRDRDKRNDFMNVVVTRTGAAINLNVACGVKDGSTEYLLAADDGGSTIKRYDVNGQNETAITFSGTAPTAIRRMGYDPANGHVWIMDGADKAATQIRRYTFSGTVLTNINSDITLGTAPSAAGMGQMYIGSNYMVLCDTTSSSGAVFKRYNKTTGVLVDSLTLTTLSTNHGYTGCCVSVTDNLFL